MMIKENIYECLPLYLCVQMELEALIENNRLDVQFSEEQPASFNQKKENVISYIICSINTIIHECIFATIQNIELSYSALSSHVVPDTLRECCHTVRNTVFTVCHAVFTQ